MQSGSGEYLHCKVLPLIVALILVVPAIVFAHDYQFVQECQFAQNTQLVKDSRKAASRAGAEKTWTVHVGAGSTKAWNYVGLTKEFMVSDNMTFFLAGGLGTILAGAGIACYSNRDGNGVAASATAGIAGAHVNLAYQFKLGQQGFLAAGCSYGVFFMQYEGFVPILSYEYRFE